VYKGNNRVDQLAKRPQNSDVGENYIDSDIKEDYITITTLLINGTMFG